MKDVMLDFETLGNGTYKCICQIGLAYFDPASGEVGETLKFNIDAGSHAKYGGKFEADTIYWWLSQSKEAQNSLLENKVDIKEAFIKVNDFLKNAKRVWSHATFDFVTLMETFKQLEIKPNVSYKAAIDIRTLVYLAGTQVKHVKRDGVHHDALDDCKHQIKYCTEAYSKLKANKAVLKYLETLKNDENV